MKNKRLPLSDRPQGARIEWHGGESGTMTSDMVEERAREIAIIEGRRPDDVNQNDRDRARLELSDDELILSSEDACSDMVASRNPADPTVEIGHEVRTQIQMNDIEQERTEKEVLEGVREAEHERMLLSRQDEEEAEGEDLVPLEAEDDEQP
jgi:hypothetical protein